MISDSLHEVATRVLEKNMVPAPGQMLAVFCTGYALCKYVNCSSITQFLPSCFIPGQIFLDSLDFCICLCVYSISKRNGRGKKKQTGNRMTHKTRLSFCTNKTPEHVCALRKFVVYFFSSLHSVLFD